MFWPKYQFSLSSITGQIKNIFQFCDVIFTMIPIFNPIETEFLTNFQTDSFVSHKRWSICFIDSVTRLQLISIKRQPINWSMYIQLQTFYCSCRLMCSVIHICFICLTIFVDINSEIQCRFRDYKGLWLPFMEVNQNLCGSLREIFI